MMGDYPVKLNTFGILDGVIASSLNLTVMHRDKLEINQTTGKKNKNRGTSVLCHLWNACSLATHLTPLMESAVM